MGIACPATTRLRCAGDLTAPVTEFDAELSGDFSELFAGDLNKDRAWEYMEPEASSRVADPFDDHF